MLYGMLEALKGGEVVDVRPHYQRAALTVVPLRVARGIQNKVLEALAMRKAVVSDLRTSQEN